MFELQLGGPNTVMFVKVFQIAVSQHFPSPLSLPEEPVGVDHQLIMEHV